MNPSILQSSGVALRSKHLESYLQRRRKFSAFEVTFENYIYSHGESRKNIISLSEDYRIHLHGVSTNIGSVDKLDRNLLRELRTLSRETNAFLLSDHLCFTRINHVSTFELLPVPLTRKMLRHVGNRLDKIRDYLKQDFLLENISSYFTYEMSEMDEPTFMAELHKQYGAHFLLDVNNLYVGSQNLGFSSREYLETIPTESVKAFHVAGHEKVSGFLFDTHGQSIQAPVKDLYKEAVRRFGMRPTFLERDENIPDDPDVLEAELDQILQLER